MSDSRSKSATPAATPLRKARVHACLECGCDTSKSGDFCSSACRAGFNNRRKKRGAEFYDLYMAHRFERDLAADMKLLSIINRLAANYRQEDRIERDGRRSWRRPQDVMAERVYLRAIATNYRGGR